MSRMRYDKCHCAIRFAHRGGKAGRFESRKIATNECVVFLLEVQTARKAEK